MGSEIQEGMDLWGDKSFLLSREREREREREYGTHVSLFQNFSDKLEKIKKCINIT